MFESLARLGGRRHDAAGLDDLIRLADCRFAYPSDLQSRIAQRVGLSPTVDRLASVARTVHDALGRALVELAAQVKRAWPAETLCVGGGFFYNSSFTTRLATWGIFDRVFVPVHPGNPGLRRVRS